MKDYEQIISTLLTKIADLEKVVIQQAARIAFDALAPFEAAILSQVKIAAVKNLDETGFRVTGKTLGKVTSICPESNMGFVINITDAN